MKQMSFKVKGTDNEIYSFFFCVRILFKLNNMKDEITVNILMCHNPLKILII